MKELEIGGYRYSVNYWEVPGGLDMKIQIKFGYSWYNVDSHSEAGRKVREIVEREYMAR